MKNWFLALFMGASLMMPVTASANEVNELCQSLGEFAGEILDGRKEGLSRSEAMGIVRESVSDLRGEEKQMVNELLTGVVQSVYELSPSEIATSNASEARVFKREFAKGFDIECRKQLR